MSFLEPLFLVGLLAAGLPLLIHLFNRRKAVKREFPALKFLIESNKRTARSTKIRQWALMALRVLVILLLALALAKPFILSSEGVSASDRLPTAVAIIVDTSASMNHGDWFERARDSAEKELRGLRPWDEVTIVTTTSDELPERLTDKHKKIRDRITSLDATHSEGDLWRALRQASDVLETSQLPNRKIVLFTDMSLSELDRANTETGSVNHPVELVEIRPKGEERPQNLSVARVQYEQEGGDANLWKIDATVKNWSDKPADNIKLQLFIGDEPLSVGQIDAIEANQEQTFTFTHRQTDSGAWAARVELQDADDYALDNAHHFVFKTRARLNALLVNGEASSVAYNDEMFFLTRALNPKRDTERGIIPTLISPEGLSTQNLSDYDAVILSNVARVPSGVAAQLEQYVRQGGGLMISAGDQIDVDSYNQVLANLLPKPLRGLKRLAKRDDPDAPVKITRLGATNHQHPIFRAFNMPGGATLQSAQIYSYMLLEPSAPEASTTLLSYKDSAPALLERTVGDGRVLLWTTSLDFEWTDFPIRSSYLPMMQRATQYLARRATSSGKDNHAIGEPVPLSVEGMVRERVIVARGGQESERFAIEPIDGTATLTPSNAGAYFVWADDSETGRKLEDLSFAMNVAPSESNLEVATGENFQAWLSARTQRGDETQRSSDRVGVNERQKRVNVWPILLFIVTLLLLGETVLGTRRSVLVKLGNKVTGKQPTSELENA